MLPHSLPSAITGIKVGDNVIPSVADNTFVEVELLLSIKSFKFRIPTTLHSLVLCTLMQDVQCTMKMNECSKTYALFSRIKNGSATFQLTFFKEGISLSLKTDESTEHCVYAKNAVRYALRRACILVGYGAPVVTNYYLPCLKHNCTIQDGGFLIDHDCTLSHTAAGNVWFSEVRAFCNTSTVVHTCSYL